MISPYKYSIGDIFSHKDNPAWKLKIIWITPLYYDNNNKLIVSYVTQPITKKNEYPPSDTNQYVLDEYYNKVGENCMKQP